MWEDSLFNIGPKNEVFNTVSFIQGLNQNSPAQGWTVCVGPVCEVQLESYEATLLQNYVHIFGIC